MEKRILINDNRDKVNEWENAVESVQSGANDLIQIFENFQPYKKIKTLKDFETLVADPLELFDKTLQANSGIDLKSSGGKIPNASVIAQLYDIDRENFINIVTGQKVTEGCKKCNKTKVFKKGEGVLNLRTYREFEKYLIWNDENRNDENRFSINEDLMSVKKESFQVYAESPDAIECYTFWHNLCDTLNSLQKKNYCGDLPAFQTLLKNRLMFSYQSHTLCVNEEMLYQEIANLK